MTAAYSPECETCVRCYEPDCHVAACLAENPAALCDLCGWVTCGDCTHDCPEGATW